MSLASQLSRLAAPAAGGTMPDQTRKRKNVRASVIYTPREAADVSLDAIHEAALDGFRALVDIDAARFERFDSPLFSASARQVNRELLGAEENAALDADLSAFMRALSPYLLLACAPPVLEYLVRRFECHLYNVRAVLEMALPFHETPIFSRIVAVLALDKDVRFNFLRRSQRSSAPLPRQVIVDAVTGNLALVDFMWAMVQRVAGGGGDSSNRSSVSIGEESSGAAVKSTLTFCTLVLIEFLRRASSGAGGHGADRVVRRMLPHVISASGSRRTPALQTMGSMVAMQLCRSFPVAPSVFGSIATAIAESLVVKSAKSSSKKSKKSAKHSRQEHRQDWIIASAPDTLHNAVASIACMFASCKPHATDVKGGLRLPEAVVDVFMCMGNRSADSGGDSVSDVLVKVFQTGKVSVVPMAGQLVLQLAEALLASTHNEARFGQTIKKITASMPCPHLVHPLLNCASKASAESSLVLVDVARTLASSYPDDVDASVAHLVASSSDDASKDKDTNESSADGTAAPVLEKIMDIFSGTRHCPVDDSGTTLFLALKHPSPAVRISGIQALEKREREESDDDAVSFESATEARFVFDAVFAIIASDDEAAVVSHAARYAENSALWSKVYANAGGGRAGARQQDSGLGDVAVTATCKALQRWSVNNAETSAETETLVLRLLGVAEALLSWLGEDTNHSADDIDDANWLHQAIVGRPLYRMIATFLPTPLGVLEDGSNAAFSPVGEKAVACAAAVARASLTGAFKNFSVAKTKTRRNVVSLLANNLGTAAALGRLESVCSDLLGSTPDMAPLWVVGQALEECVRKAGRLKTPASTHRVARRKSVEALTAPGPAAPLVLKLLDVTLSLWSCTFWADGEFSSAGLQKKVFLLQCMETLSSTYAMTTMRTSSQKVIAQQKDILDSGLILSLQSAWRCFRSANLNMQAPSTTEVAPILLLLMLLSVPPSESGGAMKLVQTILRAHLGTPARRLRVLSFVNRQINRHSNASTSKLGSIDKQPSWCIAARAMSLELTGLFFKSFAKSSADESRQSVVITGDTIASVLIAIQAESGIVRRAALRCLDALGGLTSIAPASAKLSTMSAKSRFPVPSLSAIAAFCSALLRDRAEMCTDRFYLRQAVSRFVKGKVAAQPSISGDTVIGQWLLSECATQMTYHDPAAATAVYRIFESLPPLAMIEAAGAPLILPSRASGRKKRSRSDDKGSSEPLLSKLPVHAGEVVRIVVSQYQMLSGGPSSFSADAYEVLRTLLTSPRTLRDTTSVPYSVREDALAAITPELCGLFSQEQSDELFGILFALRVVGSSGSAKGALTESAGSIRSDDPGVRSGVLIQSAIKSMDVSAGVILDLASVVAREAGNLGGGAEGNFETFDSWLAHVTVLAEVLEARDYVSSADAIAAKMIDCLDQLISSSKDGVNCEDKTTRSQHEFASVLLLSCALKLCRLVKRGAEDPRSKTSKKKQDKAQMEAIRMVKVVVRSIKWTASSQVRNAGLMLLAHLSELKSSAVLQCLVPVFSFVGKGLATAREDNYTFTVVRRILKTVVPALPEGNLHGVLGVFVDAFDSMMPHRRLELFKAVVNSMRNRGPDLLAWVVSAFISGSISKARTEDAQGGRASENDDDSAVASVDDDGYITNSSTSREMVRCCHDLCASFKLPEQARMIAAVLAAATSDEEDAEDAEDEDEDDNQIKPPPALLSTLPILVDAEKKNNVQATRRKVKSALLKFASNHLNTKGFVRRLMQLQQAVRRRSAVVPSGTAPNKTLLALQEQERVVERCFLSSYAGILRKLHVLSSESSCSDEDDAKEQDDEMFLHGILGSLVSMLTVPTFLAVLTELLKNGNPSIRVRALQLLNTKVVEDADDLMEHEVALFLDLVDELSGMAFPKRDFDVASIQAALYSLNFIATAFAENHPGKFVPMLKPLTRMLRPEGEGGLKTDAANDALRSTVFCTLATLCIKLGPRVIPTIPVLVPALVKDLQRSLKRRTAPPTASEESTSSLTQTASLLLRGALTSLAQVIAHIPAFVKPYLGTVLRVLLRHSTVRTLSARPQDQHVADNIVKLTYSRTEIEPRVLLPIIFGLRAQLLEDSAEDEAGGDDGAADGKASHPASSTLARLYALLRNVVVQMDNKTVRLHYNTVFRFVLEGCKDLFSLPREGAAEVRSALVAVVVELVLRLSERRMRPMFLEAVAFAKAGSEDSAVSLEENMSRRAFLYELVGALSESLKSIFCPFFEHVIPGMSRDLLAWLHRAPEEEHEEEDGDGRAGLQGGRDKKRRKKSKRESYSSTGASEWSVSGKKDARFRHYEMIELLTEGLHKCFMFDNAAILANVDGYAPFVTKGRFDLLVEPLCDLLGSVELIPSGKEGFEAFMEETVEPCIAHFAASCPDDMTRKTLHNKLLMQTRSDLAVVRTHAIMALKACFDQVGEDYLFLVPETLPFMAELLEDSDGRVERLAHELKKQVEDLSGEGLDTYLVGE